MLRRRPQFATGAFRRRVLVAAAIGVLVLASTAAARADDTQVPGLGEWGRSPGAAPAPPPATGTPPAHDEVEVEPPRPVRAIRETQGEWYGAETLLADGVSLGVLPIVEVATESGFAAYFAVVGYVLAPPIIHFAHGRAGAGFGSLALRIVMPLGGALLGAPIGQAADGGGCPNLYCIKHGAEVGLLIGAGLGALGAVSIDAVTSHETSSSIAPSATSSRRAKTVALCPAFGPRREGGFDVGLSGAF